MLFEPCEFPPRNAFLDSLSNNGLAILNNRDIASRILLYKDRNIYVNMGVGQFYTVKHDYILDGFEKPKGPIIEPFAGQGDLIDWLGRCDVESYDIEPKRNDIIERDTLINPPSYGNKWVITNPPYLARNKCDSKQIFDMYKTNDLYKCFIMSVVNQNEKCLGGIFIIPVGFFLSPREMDVHCRHCFLSKYKITRVKYFEEVVFPDTTTTVVAFSFVKSDKLLSEQNIPWERYPNGDKKIFKLESKHKWIIGGEIYDLKIPKTIKIKRVVKDHENNNMTYLTLSALDTTKKISLEYTPGHVYEGINTSRTYATLCISGIELDEEKEKRIAQEFNNYLNKKREETWSLFLPQFREYDRRRIPFSLAYSIVGDLINKIFM
jgi:hypothetical protein